MFVQCDWHQFTAPCCSAEEEIPSPGVQRYCILSESSHSSSVWDTFFCHGHKKIYWQIVVHIHWFTSYIIFRKQEKKPCWCLCSCIQTQQCLKINANMLLVTLCSSKPYWKS